MQDNYKITELSRIGSANNHLMSTAVMTPELTTIQMKTDDLEEKDKNRFSQNLGRATSVNKLI